MADHKTPSPVPKTDDTDFVKPISGGDRSRLNEDGWAEVPDDLIGGHPELEVTPKPGVRSLNNEELMSPRTGAPVRKS